MPIILKNNVDSTLAQAINASETAVIVTAGDGAKFPALSAGDYFYATLVSAQNTREIVKVTGKSIDTLAITRAQEGTTANGFAVGSRVEMRVTAASITDLVDEHDQATEITIADAGGYYTSGTVEGALQEAAQASTTKYNRGGTGAVTRTVQNRLQDFVSVKDFGAVGDGVADDTAAIQRALSTGKDVLVPAGSFFFNLPLLFAADNQTIHGNGNTSILKHRGTGSAGPSWISSAGYDNVTLCNLQLEGGSGVTAANPGLHIEDGSKNASADGVFFSGGNQVIYLGTCSNVKVVNNTFDGCGYGVIQQFGYSSSYVLVDGNTCMNSGQDFVEANCASTAPSEHWIISNNTYNTAAQFPTPATEARFVGVTSVRGVVITGNTITKAAGDSAIHLEDTLGDTVISSNVFDNCLVSGGNNAYLFLLNSAESTVVSDNIFMRTDTGLPAAYALSVNSNNYDNPIVMTGNIVKGAVAGGNMSGFDLSFQTASSSATCVGNTFVDLNTAILVNNTYNANVSSNSFVRCTTGVTSGAGALLNSIINGNNFIATAGTSDIVCAAATRLDVQNNRFFKSVNLGTCTDVLVNNNTFGSTATLTNPSGTRAYAPSNTFEAAGVTQARYQNIGSAYQLSASKRAAAVGGSAVSTFRISCVATAAGWRPGIINIRASAGDANTATQTAAWWAYKFQVLGGDPNTLQAVEDSGGTVANYSITFANVSATAAELVFDVAVTAIGADYLAVDLSGTYYEGIKAII